MLITEARKLAIGAAGRLKAMRSTVDRLDGEIQTLEKERRRADPGEAWRIGQRIRELTEQRLAGSEIVAAAEQQSADASTAFLAATKEACVTVGSIARDAEAAAARMEAALADALSALTDLESALERGAHTILVPGRERFKWPAIQSALFAAFASRRGSLATTAKDDPISRQVAMIVDAMRRNAVALAKNGYSWGGN